MELVVVVVEVVIAGAIVVLVLVLVLVVVLAFTIETPNDEICGTIKLLRVLYPETVKCTPSLMKLLLDLGVNAVFQSAIVKFGYRSFANRNSLLKRTPRARQSLLPVCENSKLTQRTGRPRVFCITMSITQRGYQVSGLEIMSLVPSATTMAVVEELTPFLITLAPSDALRPTFASIVTLVQMPRAFTFFEREPNTSVPTVRLSPTTYKVP